MGAALIVALVLLTRPKRGPPCPLCMQDVASATYFAFNQLDCDGQEGDLGCSTGGALDELQNVNHGPRLESVKVLGNGDVVVTLRVFLAGGHADLWYVVEFSPTGGIVSAN